MDMDMAHTSKDITMDIIRLPTTHLTPSSLTFSNSLRKQRRLIRKLRSQLITHLQEREQRRLITTSIMTHTMDGLQRAGTMFLIQPTHSMDRDPFQDLTTALSHGLLTTLMEITVLMMSTMEILTKENGMDHTVYSTD